MEYQVVSEENHNEVWARGFYNNAGKERAQTRVNAGYFHKFTYEKDKHKKLIVIPVSK